MDDVFVYIAPLPDGVSEMVTPCADGYTVYLSDRLDKGGRLEAYRHAVHHIRRNDFAKRSVQKIEADAHGGK